jgi:hypothetical protein
MQIKMAQQGKQVIVGAREGYAKHSVELVLLYNGNMYEVDINKLVPNRKAVYLFKLSACPNSELMTHVCTVKASNFGPHVNFGLLFRRVCYHHNAFYRTMKRNESYTKTLDVQIRFCFS